MRFLCCWHGNIRKVGIRFARNGLLIERVPCDVYLGNVVEVPAQTCSNGAEGRTLDENLAILASDYKDFLLGVKGGVEQELELVGSAFPANTIDKGNYSSRILYRWCLGIYKCDSVVFFVYHDAPCVAGDFRGGEEFGVESVYFYQAVCLNSIFTIFNLNGVFFCHIICCKDIMCSIIHKGNSAICNINNYLPRICRHICCAEFIDVNVFYNVPILNSITIILHLYLFACGIVQSKS